MKIGAFLQNAQQQIVTCSPSDTAQEAAEVMQRSHIGAMPVVSADGKLVGMISERDISIGFSKNGKALADLKVSDLLAKRVIFMGPGATMHDALETMHKYGFRHVPILAEGEVMGIVSIRDVLAHYVENVGADGAENKLSVA